MCSPQAAFIGLAIGSAALQGVAGARENQQNAANFETQAQIQERNASLERVNASVRRERVVENAERVAADQIGQFSAAGVAPIESVILDSAREADREIQAIEFGADVEVESANINAAQFRERGRDESAAAPISFISPFVSTGARIAGAFI